MATRQNKYKINGFKVFRSDRLERKGDRNKEGGVALYVRENIKCKVIIKFSSNNCEINNCDFIFVETVSKFLKMCTCVIYRTNKCSTTDSLKLFNLIIEKTSIYNDVLIIGDFNINISNNTNRLKVLNDHFAIVNHFCPTHKWPSAEPSLIDIILTKNINRIQHFSH